jgi:hypothetical protein
MASAGVVGMAEVVQPNSAVTATNASMIATWSFVWAGFAALFLVFIHLALMGRSGR